MKKIYRNEKGRFCKYWQTPEAKAKAKARRQTPEYKAKDRARNQTPERKAKLKAGRQTPESKAKDKAWQQTPEAKAKNRARSQTPEAKAKAKARNQIPEVKARAKARRQTPEYKATAKARRQTPEGKARAKANDAFTRAKRLKRHVLLDKAGRKKIAKIFAGCPEDWHVDHIAPMLGDTISGLHLPENLQYLPAWVNHMKGKRWEESWIEHTIDTPLEEKIKAYQLNYEGEKWHE